MDGRTLGGKTLTFAVICVFMAVFLFLFGTRYALLGITVSSAATHTDELGNPPHYGTREKLAREHIPLVPHRARLLTREDGEKYDFILGMDEANVRNMRRILGDHSAKTGLLLDFSDRPRAIADPWYTGNFDVTFSDIAEGCTAFLGYLIKEGLI